MKVAVDARWSQPRPLGGVGRGLAHQLPWLDGHCDLTLLTDPRMGPTGLGAREVPLRSPGGPAAVWLQVSAPRWLARERPDVFHCPWYGLPFRQPVPSVVTIHDLTFEHRPEWFSRSHRLTYRTQARHAARTARVVLTVSEHVRHDIMATYDVDGSRVVVAANAVDPVFHPRGAKGGYLLAIGGAERRRLDLAVEAWRSWGRHLPLHVLGTEVVDEPGVTTLGRLDDEGWAVELARADALVYPTEDEGFGLPALEAIASGTPVVAARVGSLPEVLGDCAVWADSLTATDLARALGRVGGADRERGLARAQAWPTWADSAAVLLQAYERAAG
jgi:glycosyltransferase involved in cell wall biosynthesis